MAVDTQEFDRIVPGIMRGTAELLGLEAKTDCEVGLRPAYGPGYALPSDEGSEAIRLMARCEGIFLDPVYTGKAFAGLIEMVRSGSLEQEENILFLLRRRWRAFAIDFDWHKHNEPRGTNDLWFVIVSENACSLKRTG